jgi:hypothetical protein
VTVQKSVFHATYCCEILSDKGDSAMKKDENGFRQPETISGKIANFATLGALGASAIVGGIANKLRGGSFDDGKYKAAAKCELAFRRPTIDFAEEHDEEIVHAAGHVAKHLLK